MDMIPSRHHLRPTGVHGIAAMKPARVFVTAICLAALSVSAAHAGKVYPAWVIPETLNVRSGPGTDRGLIGTLTRGTKVYVTAFANNWCWAKLPDGSWGWIAEWLLQFSADRGRQLAEQAGQAASSSSSSSSAPPAWVCAEGNVNVRSGPGTHYDSRGQIGRGTKVYIVGEERGWLKCRTPGGYGWIRADLLERDVERGRQLAGSITSPHTTASTQVDSAKAYVNGDGVRLRSGPGTSHRVKASLVAGQVLYVTERRGEWVRAQVHGGQDGWIHASLVKYEQGSGTGAGSGTSGSSGSSGTAKGYVNGDTVHLRAGPSLNERIKARVVRGQVLYITERQGDWCHVTVHGGEEGWIHASLVKLEGGTPATGAASPPPAAATGAAGTSMQPIPAWIGEDVVNVRYGPGTDHDIKFRLSTGAAVEVLELSGHWCKIRDGGGNVGWVAGWVMNFRGPGQDPTAREGDEEVAVRTAWVA
ncbi:MAG TPA: hypothetical protein ENN42_07100, partial [Thioalkalivibrio sp.]|nr:hypothetical protein [Thioalkalivibrio sp.]